MAKHNAALAGKKEEKKRKGKQVIKETELFKVIDEDDGSQSTELRILA